MRSRFVVLLSVVGLSIVGLALAATAQAHAPGSSKWMWSTGGCKHQVVSNGLRLDPLFEGGADRHVYPATVACVGLAEKGEGYCEFAVKEKKRYFDHFLVLVWTPDRVVRLFKLHVRGKADATWDGMEIIQRDASRTAFERDIRSAVQSLTASQQELCERV